MPKSAQKKVFKNRIFSVDIADNVGIMGSIKSADDEGRRLKEASMYEITRLFTSGILVGLTYTETTSVYMPVGFECKNPCAGGSSYKIIACKAIN